MRKSQRNTGTDQKLETALRIKKERESLGLTQEQLAERMGMTVDNYKKIEEGINAMSMQSLRKIGTALDVSYDYLLDGRQEPVEEIAKQVNSLSRAEQTALLIRIAANLSQARFREQTVARCIGTKELVLTEEEKGES